MRFTVTIRLCRITLKHFENHRSQCQFSKVVKPIKSATLCGSDIATGIDLGTALRLRIKQDEPIDQGEELDGIEWTYVH